MCESVGHGNIGCHSGGGTQTAGQAKLPKRGVAELKAMLAQMGAIHIADLQDVRSEVFAGVSGGFQTESIILLASVKGPQQLV